VATKGTKNASSAEGFFAAHALRCKAGKTAATLISPGDLCAFKPCMSRTYGTDALPGTGPALFCLLSGEAGLLRGKIRHAEFISASHRTIEFAR